ncbi:MAG: hypothetical protein ACKOAD_03700 [Gammaproteobacteria bacterium]
MFYRARQAILWGLSLALFLIYTGKYLVWDIQPMMQADSGGYLNYSAARTLGYPWFLSLVEFIFGSHKAVPWVQHAVFFLSLAYLTHQINRYLGLLSLAILTLLGVGLQIELIKYNFQIMSESISVSILMLMMGLIVQIYATKFRLRPFLYFSFLVGLHLLIRPVHKLSAFVLVLMLFNFYALKRINIKQAIWLVLPFLAWIGLGLAGQKYLHNVWQQEVFFGFNWIGKVSLIAKPGSKNTSTYPEFDAAFIKNVEPVQLFLKEDNVRSFQMRYLLSAVYYDYFRYLARPELDPKPLAASGQSSDKVYGQLAFEYVKANPMAYVKDIGMNLTAVWLFLDLMTVKEKEELAQFLKQQPLPYIEKWPYSLEVKAQNYLAIPLRVIFGALFLVTLYVSFAGGWLILKGRFEKSALSSLLFYASVFIQTHHLGIAVFQAGIPRYGFVMWPALVVAGACFLLKSYEVYQQNKQPSLKQAQEAYVI